MQRTDVILTLTATDAGTLSTIGQPYDNRTTLSQVLAGQVSFTIGGNAVSRTTAEILGNVTENAAKTAIEFKDSNGTRS